MERPISARGPTDFLAPKIVADHPHSFPNDTFEGSSVTFSLPVATPNLIAPFTNIISSMTQNTNGESTDTYDYSYDSSVMIVQL